MERSTTTDEALAAAAAGGDDDAFGVLYARYATPVHDFASRLTRSREDGADVTQLTFERAWRNLARRRTDKRFKPWLFAIAHNTAVEVLRKRRPTASVDDEEAGVFAVLASPSDSEAGLERGGVAHDVWAAAAALSRTEYSVLHHQFRSNMEPEEIAATMHMKIGAVYTALSRARGSLEEAFTAFQLARRGRRDCPRLDAVLGGQSPKALDGSTRRAIRRHIGGCDTCEANSKRFVAPAELFAAFVPLAAPPGLAAVSKVRPDRRRGQRRPSRATRLRWAAAAGIGCAALVAGAVAVSMAGDGLAEDTTAPRDPTTVASGTHEVGVPSTKRVVEVEWSRASDPGHGGQKISGVAGYAILWTQDRGELPPERQTLPREAASARSDELSAGEWWFVLRTVDGAGNWTRTARLGPFVIAVACPATVHIPYWQGEGALDFSVLRVGDEASVRARSSSAPGLATFEMLAASGVSFGISVDGEAVASVPVTAAGIEARIDLPRRATEVVLTHGVPIASASCSDAAS